MKPARLAAPSSTVPRFPTVIMVMVVREYSRRRERTTGVAFLAIVFASVNVVVVFVPFIWKVVRWEDSTRVPVSASASSSLSDGRSSLVYWVFSRSVDPKKSWSISRIACILSFERLMKWY